MFPSPEAAAHYLAAMIDGEGHVADKVYERDRTSGRKQYQRYVVIVNTDPDIIEACKEACDQLGIPHRVYDRDRKGDAATLNRKHQWSVVIASQAGLRMLLERVPLRAASKLATLKSAVAGYRPAPRYDEARALYESGRTITEVAEELGVPWATAQLWIKKSGAEIRTGSGSVGIEGEAMVGAWHSVRPTSRRPKD